MNAPYDLPAELTIYNVVETRDSLLAWVAAQTARPGSQLAISASQVAEVDGAGLQLLAALFNMELPWRLVDPSESFAQACQTLGLADWVDRSGPRRATGGGSS